MTPAQIDDMKATIKSFKKYVTNLPHIRHKVSPDKLGITISLHDFKSIITMQKDWYYTRTDYHHDQPIKTVFQMRDDFPSVLVDLLALHNEEQEQDKDEYEVWGQDLSSTIKALHTILNEY
jgi:hypothetical protein